MKIRINGEWLIAASEVLLIFYLCLPISMLFLNSLAIKGLVFIAAFFFVAGLSMMNKWKYLLEFIFLFFVTMLFWIVVWKRQYDSIAYIYYCFASISFAFGAVIMYKSEDVKIQHSLFLLLTLVFTITAFTTIIGLGQYPYAAREMARGSTYNTSLDFDFYKSIYRRMNIAGWSQIYGMLFAVPCACMMLKKKRSKFYYIVLVLSEGAIISSQITFAILLSLGLIFAVIAIGENNSKVIIVSFLSLFALAIILVNMDFILSQIISISTNLGFDFLTIKFSDLKALLVYRQAVGDTSARGNLYKSSFEAFLDSPIVGAMFNKSVADNSISRHSDLLDMLGGIGIIGLVGIVFAIVKYRKFIKTTSVSVRKELSVIFLGFLALSFLNPVLNSPQIFIGAFLYTALTAKMCEYVNENAHALYRN